MKIGLHIFVILCTFVTVKGTEKSAVARLLDVLDAVLYGEEKINEAQKRDPPKDLGGAEQIFSKKEKSSDLELESAMRRHTAKRLLENTGMTEEELRDSEVVQTTLRELNVCPDASFICPTNRKYRTIDGSCNNVQHKTWGQAFTVQERWLNASYGSNNSPRQGGSSPLPSARLVSNLLFNSPDESNLDRDFTTLLMAWGQFTDHDITKTPTAGSFDCCDETVAGTTDDCFPIEVPDNDERFTDCLNFVRSMAYSDDCTTTQRDQINELTAYIDANNVYGSSQEELNVLIHTEKPYLLNFTTSGNLLPEGPSFCLKQDQATDFCPHAGDTRVNTQPPLSLLHNLMMREHNRIAQILKDNNAVMQWSDDTIFEETRKIIGAIIQHVTYKEWLPNVIGRKAMQDYDLSVTADSHRDMYDSETNAQIRNAFAAAALRYGHSIIPPTVGFMNHDWSVSEENTLLSQFLNPHMLIQNSGAQTSDLARWVHFSKSANSDNEFVSDLRNNLFGTSDLPARNVQRGRDHGLPAYIEYKKFCNPGEHVKPLDSVKQELHDTIKNLYPDLNTIDLYAGAMSEEKVNGADVGPTFACLIGKQFELFKKGDAFWYERPTVEGFDIEQLRAIKDVTMSSLFCANFDLSRIQENPFRQEKTTGCNSPPPKKRGSGDGKNQDPPCNLVKMCEDFPPLRLEPWVKPPSPTPPPPPPPPPSGK